MERLFEPVAVAGEQFPIACECGNAGCVEMLAVTDVEYDAVRRSASRFVIQPCHELPGVERVVAANPRFVVVERLDDAGERGAQERDRAT